jgi:hypothetical protein
MGLVLCTITIEILKAEKIHFTENLLHCTATTTKKNENLSLR